MASVRDILAVKGSTLHRIDSGRTVLEATRYMNEQKIGALVVENEGRVAGIFTERDVLMRVVAEERDPAKMLVRDAMTCQVICADPETDLDNVRTLMRDRRIRHVPICQDDGRLVGMISIGDLNAFQVSLQESTIHQLNDYICGRA